MNTGIDNLVYRNMDIETIHNSLVNGQRRQMVEQIDEYGSEFWAKYVEFLTALYVDGWSVVSYMRDAIVSYHRIKNR